MAAVLKHTCPKDLGHVDLQMTIYNLRIKSKRLTPMLGIKEKMVTMNGLYDTRLGRFSAKHAHFEDTPAILPQRFGTHVVLKLEVIFCD